MTGVITEIFDDNVEAFQGRPEIKKKIAVIGDLFNPDRSVAVEFTGRLRTILTQGFKVNDKVEVEYQEKVKKSKKGKVFNNKKATSIKRL